MEYICPVCRRPMESGVIYCDRRPFRWISDAEDCGYPLMARGVKLNGIGDEPYLKAYMCRPCKKVIIDFEN